MTFHSQILSKAVLIKVFGTTDRSILQQWQLYGFTTEVFLIAPRQRVFKFSRRFETPVKKHMYVFASPNKRDASIISGELHVNKGDKMTITYTVNLDIDDDDKWSIDPVSDELIGANLYVTIG
jgi:hypothetical protein